MSEPNAMRCRPRRLRAKAAGRLDATNDTSDRHLLSSAFHKTHVDSCNSYCHIRL